MPFSIIRNDITKVQADAIVNTANFEPTVGSGVDSAIYRAAGWDDLLEERRRIGRIEPGEARATNAFSLPTKYVIHTVGPVWCGGRSGEQETLARCYRNSLTLAVDLGCESVAFPLISTGTFSFPKDLALSTAISEISTFLTSHDISVILVVYNKEAFVLSGRIFADVRSYIEEKDVLVREYLDQNRRARILADLSSRDLSRGPVSQPDISGQNRDRRPEAQSYSSEPERGGLKKSLSELLGNLAPGKKRETGSEEARGALPDMSIGSAVDEEGLEDFLKNRGETFQQKLFHMIDRKRLDDRDVYKRSNIDRKLFSKIKSNVDYNPSKKTVLAFAIGMELNMDETVDLLRSAGLAFTPASVFDLIVEYCITHEYYNIIDINCMLFDNGQPTLGA